MKKIITLTAVISLLIFILFSTGGCKEGITKENVEEAIAEDTEDIDDEPESAETDELSESSDTYSGELGDARIAFVCASVGSNWNIKDHFPNLDITVYEEYQFDKENVIMDILQSNRPDIMIIKECAAYFPPETSMDAYKNLIRDWVNLYRDSGVIPVLTTVVPIDPNNPSNQGGQLESILEFNDWIRNYCVSENLSYLDLEAALRVSEDNRTLNPEYDSGDGLHPNDLAYTEKLDHILIPALEQALRN
ncbi:MAG TPA: GDSL-type esterase/lipase family protein [Candidatus Humimicrobiaceae bacterium]|nr:GDSL-type esterase/lipase family protein [Candidatus Humimicrobiaceae bacterium]